MADFDLSLYFPIPMLSTEGYVSLTMTLIDVAPKNPPPHLETVIAALALMLYEAKSGLVERIDEDLSTGLERSFDALVDRVWLELRERLEFLAIYMHDGAAKFTDEDRAILDFEDKLEQARVAAKLIDRLFGDGVEFLRAAFPQQAAATGARLDWLHDKHMKVLPELVGQDLVLLLERCQIRYEEMVSQRSSRAGKSLADLRVLRDRLRRQVYAYCGAVGSMVDYNSPASMKIAEDALRPILISRANARRKTIELIEDNVLDELMPEGVDPDEGAAAREDAPEGEPAID